MRRALLTEDSGFEAETRERPSLLVSLLMGACLLACLVGLAICLLLTPIVCA